MTYRSNKIFYPNKGFHLHTTAFGKNIASVLCFYLYILASVCGCHKQSSAPVIELKEAHETFRRICAEELNIDALLVPLENTLHIYVPVAFDLFRTTAAAPERTSAQDPSPKRQINFLETSWKDSVIVIPFDIAVVNAYPKSQSYTSAYTDDFSRIHNGLLSALTRSYNDLPEDQPLMEFIVMQIMDTRNGVGIKNLFHMKDLQRVMTGALPQDEYAKRYMTEVTGDRRLINNPTGRGLTFSEMTWPEFIVKQIAYRINFKYTRSAFPPAESDIKEILTTVHETTQGYDFNAFAAVELNDLANQELFRFDRDQIRTFTGW